MRIHHKIILLTGLVLCINLGFQILWIFEFVGVKGVVQEYQDNWLPTTSLTGRLGKRIGEFRLMEYAYLLSDSEQELAAMARSFDRQKLSLARAESGLEEHVRTRAEREVYARYVEARTQYLKRHNHILAAMAGGSVQAAQAELEGQSERAFQAMSLALDSLRLINKQYADQAGQNAEKRFAGVLMGMGLALAANFVVGLGAVWLTTRRIGRPITQLAACMREDMHGVPTCSDLPEPVGAPEEIVALYRSYQNLTAKLATTLCDLETQAITDALTSLANRRRLMEGGARILEICKRGGLSCVVLMADIDHFKKVNDTLGHAAGDQVLRGVAGVLAAGVRGSDLAARYGGEEFVVVAPSAGLGQGCALAERLRRDVAAMKVDWAGQTVQVTISLGVAVAQSGAATLEVLLGQADQALYAAKHRGRNRVEVYAPSESDATEVARPGA